MIFGIDDSKRAAGAYVCAHPTPYAFALIEHKRASRRATSFNVFDISRDRPFEATANA
jgi:hypothetical protein